MSNSSVTWKIRSDLTSGHQLFLNTCRNEVIAAFQGSLFSVSTQLSMQGDRRCASSPGCEPGFRSWLSYPEAGTSGKCHCLSGPQFPLAVKWEGEGLCFRWCSWGSWKVLQGLQRRLIWGLSVGGDSHAKRELLWFCILCFWLWINDFYR